MYSSTLLDTSKNFSKGVLLVGVLVLTFTCVTRSNNPALNFENAVAFSDNMLALA